MLESANVVEPYCATHYGVLCKTIILLGLNLSDPQLILPMNFRLQAGRRPEGSPGWSPEFVVRVPRAGGPQEAHLEGAPEKRYRTSIVHDVLKIALPALDSHCRRAI